jgi:hypothetical protein
VNTRLWSVSAVGAISQIAVVGLVTSQLSGSVAVREVIFQPDGPLMAIIPWPPFVAPGKSNWN